MKTISSTILFVLMLPTGLCAQRVTIERLQARDLEIDQDNYLNISVDNLDCDSIIIKSTASVRKTDRCQWVISPKELLPPPGLKIEIFRLNNSDTILIDWRYYRIIRFDATDLSFGGKYNGDSISMRDLQTQTNIDAFESYNHRVIGVTKIKSFKLLVLRDMQVVSIIDNDGHTFTKELLNLFTQLKPGDKLYFLDIKFADIMNYSKSPYSMNLTLVE